MKNLKYVIRIIVGVLLLIFIYNLFEARNSTRKEENGYRSSMDAALEKWKTAAKADSVRAKQKALEDKKIVLNQSNHILERVNNQYLAKYSGAYSVVVDFKSDWEEIYVLTNNSNAKWMFLDVKTKDVTVMKTLNGNWTASNSSIKISINGSPEEAHFELINGIFYHKILGNKRHLKPTSLDWVNNLQPYKY